VYDITDAESFTRVRRWVTELRERAPRAKLCIAGNKCDLESRREVRREDAESFTASVGIPHFSCSAKTGDGVNDAFRAITESMAREQQARVQRPLGRADDGRVRLTVLALGRRST
jgi:GTPase SAR1 family protein